MEFFAGEGLNNILKGLQVDSRQCNQESFFNTSCHHVIVLHVEHEGLFVQLSEGLVILAT